jgi:hypothetical protein
VVVWGIPAHEADPPNPAMLLLLLLLLLRWLELVLLLITGVKTGSV